jgi:DNA-directed RNA polymerase specialized sigma subunit
MASTLHEKIKKLGRARQEKIQARADQLIAEERSLRELREAHRLTQQEIGGVLGIGQHGVSRLEKRTDLPSMFRVH